MHKLNWSRALVDIVESLSEMRTFEPKPQKTWRYAKLESYETVIKTTKKAVDAYISKPFNYLSSMQELELLNPLQRFVGCSSGIGGHRLIVCLIGPVGNFTIFDMSGNSRKIPGSECHKRYQNEGGLCVANIKEEESYYGHPQDIFEDVNQIRKEYSKNFNVSNMHQLIWSDDLLKNLQNMVWNNGSGGARVTWRYVHLPTYIKISIESELSTFFNKTPLEKRLFIRSNSDTTLGSLEFLNPLQKFIACSRISNVPSLICLLGTEGKFTIFDSSGNSKEIPGSNCQKGYTNDSGVCVANKPEEESYFGRQLDFMSDVNKIRRRYAKEYRVPSMHELTWNNKLAEVLEPLDMTGLRAQSKKTWRFGALNTYDNIIYHIEADVSSFFEMNRTAKKLHIKNLSGHGTMYRLEFLNPLQKTIACGRKEDDGVTYVICLLGPEGNFTIFDTTFQSHAAAGSKCDEGYHDEDGLCSLQIPTQVPIIDYRKMANEEKNEATTGKPEPEPLFENHGNEISLSKITSVSRETSEIRRELRNLPENWIETLFGELYNGSLQVTDCHKRYQGAIGSQIPLNSSEFGSGQNKRFSEKNDVTGDNEISENVKTNTSDNEWNVSENEQGNTEKPSLDSEKEDLDDVEFYSFKVKSSEVEEIKSIDLLTCGRVGSEKSEFFEVWRSRK